MQADEVQNAKEPIVAQIDLSGQTLNESQPPSSLPPLFELDLERHARSRPVIVHVLNEAPP